MRRKFTLMTKSLVIVGILISSCSKEDEIKNGPPPEVTALQLAARDGARDQVYVQMSSQEKYDLWKQHFKYLKDDLRSDPDKVVSIENLESCLTVKLFEPESDERATFLAVTLPGWIEKVKGIFSDEELFEVIMENRAAPVVPVQTDIHTPDCFCHVGNNGYKCKKIKLSIPPSLDYGVCEQGSTVCDYSRYGCGALWLESCNGSHCSF
jgi:hypothetical protein